jgi:hypothetical protein
MAPEDITRAITAAVTFVAWFTGHMVGDHWLQTTDQSDKKDLATHGRACALWHCAKHVATYGAASLAGQLAAMWWLGVPMRWGWIAAGLAVNLITHFIADLRTPLRWIARKSGNGAFHDVADHGMNGRYLLDQSWHILWIFVGSLISAGR